MIAAFKESNYSSRIICNLQNLPDDSVKKIRKVLFYIKKG